MAPAAKCEGCGATWKTEHEPAAPGEMNNLLNTVAKHKGDVISNMGLNVMAGVAESMGAKPTENRLIHKVRFTYHETTPEKGFEKAQVITGK